MAKNMTYTERLKIEMYLKEHKTQREIAVLLGRHYNTINYEIKRGTTKLRDGATWLEYDYYSADIGQKKHDEHAQNKGRDLKICNDYDFVKHIEHCILDLKYSPYASLVSARGKCRTDVCVTTLYHYIDRGLFMNVTNKNLPWRRDTPKQEYKHVRPSYKNQKGRSIEERPAEIKKRKTAGHWEFDTVVGGQGKSTDCLLVLTERKTRDEIVMKMPDKSQKAVASALDDLERSYGADRFREVFRSITCDNGTEFLDQYALEKSVTEDTPRTVIYYCHPHNPGERGSNENQNRLIRRWFPKGCDFKDVTPEQVASVQDWLNNYPRRMFGGKSSNEMKAM